MDTNEDKNPTGINAPEVDMPHNKILAVNTKPFEQQNGHNTEEEFAKNKTPHAAVPPFSPTTPPVEAATILPKI